MKFLLGHAITCSGIQSDKFKGICYLLWRICPILFIILIYSLYYLFWVISKLRGSGSNTYFGWDPVWTAKFAPSPLQWVWQYEPCCPSRRKFDVHSSALDPPPSSKNTPNRRISSPIPNTTFPISSQSLGFWHPDCLIRFPVLSTSLYFRISCGLSGMRCTLLPFLCSLHCIFLVVSLWWMRIRALGLLWWFIGGFFIIYRFTLMGCTLGVSWPTQDSKLYWRYSRKTAKISQIYSSHCDPVPQWPASDSSWIS